jgi:hypothetical protein
MWSPCILCGGRRRRRARSALHAALRPPGAARRLRQRDVAVKEPWDHGGAVLPGKTAQ